MNSIQVVMVSLALTFFVTSNVSLGIKAEDLPHRQPSQTSPRAKQKKTTTTKKVSVVFVA